MTVVLQVSIFFSRVFSLVFVIISFQSNHYFRKKLYDYMGLICKENFEHTFSKNNTLDEEDFFKELLNVSVNHVYYNIIASNLLF